MLSTGPLARIYPNPTAGIVIFESGEITPGLKLINAAGQELDMSFVTLDQSRVYCDLSDLPEGMYFLVDRGRPHKIVRSSR